MQLKQAEQPQDFGQPPGGPGGGAPGDEQDGDQGGEQDDGGGGDESDDMAAQNPPQQDDGGKAPAAGPEQGGGAPGGGEQQFGKGGQPGAEGLTRKVVTDKNGHQVAHWVRTGDAASSDQPHRAPEVRNDKGRLLAPNGKPSRLTEAQWHQVRSPNFKAWFGDWEAARDLQVSDSMSRDGAESALKAIAGKPLVNAETGFVGYVNRDQRDKILSAAAEEKSLNNGFSAEQHYAIAARVESLWKHATMIGDYDDAKNNDKNMRIKRFASPVVVDGKTRYVTLLATETISDADGHRVYTIEVHEEKTLRGTLGNLTTRSDSATSPTRSVDEIVAALDAKVNPEGVSRAVDKNGEPMVLYHATWGDFSSFDRNRLGENTAGNASDDAMSETARIGHWFIDRDVADDIGATVSMPVFLNLRSPPPAKSLQTLGKMALKTGGGDRLAQSMRDVGHDGFIVRDEEFAGRSFVALDSNQIKSAIGNNGAFDPSNPDITKAASQQQFGPITKAIGMPPVIRIQLPEVE